MTKMYKDEEGNVYDAVQYNFQNWEEVAALIGIPPFHSGSVIADGPIIHITLAHGREIHLHRSDVVCVDALGNISLVDPTYFFEHYKEIPLADQPADPVVDPPTMATGIPTGTAGSPADAPTPATTAGAPDTTGSVTVEGASE